MFNEDILIKKIPIQEKNQEATLYFCKTDKFKTFYTSCIFLFDYNYLKRPVNILLAYLLDRSTAKHPVEEEFIGHLYDLYDMMHSISQNQIGLIDYITFRTGTVNTKYIHEDIDLLDEAINLLHEAIFEPSFNLEIFEEIKESLIENINNRKNNKVSVAYDRFFNIMFENEVVNTKVLRDPAVFKNITIEDLKIAYKELLEQPHIYFYVGEDDEENVVSKLSGFDFPISKENKLNKVDSEEKEIKDVTEVIEEYNVNQSNIFIGLRTNVRSDNNDYYAMHLFNLMIGDYSNSELFRIVREKYGLSYNISSVYNPDKGYMLIRGGIGKDSFEKTYETIKEIIERYQSGDIDNDNLEITKKGVITAIKSDLDTFSSIYNTSIAYFINGKIRTTQEKIDLINKVTTEDIKRVANTLVLDTVYFMKGLK